ncbi:MAG: divergent polysaccharide deacetylase family protein [Pseudomonas sp.]
MSLTRWFALAWLLGLLAACGESEQPPAKPTQQVVETPGEMEQRRADAAYREQLRAGWLELENADRQSAVPPPEPVIEAPPAAVVETSSPASTIPAIAILIDDVGHNLRQGRRLLALPVALAILPHTQAAQQLAAEAATLGRTVILHQPMENSAGLSIGPGGLYSRMDAIELRQVLQHNLNSFTPIRGINNHMGSRLTGERDAMDEVMQVLKERGLFFIDSRTTHHTQAAFAAEAAGVRHLSRDVFLDNERDAAAIAAAFSQALSVARKQGSALIIGHPYPQTIAFLEQRLAEDLLVSEGVEMVSVDELLERKYRR